MQITISKTDLGPKSPPYCFIILLIPLSTTSTTILWRKGQGNDTAE